MSQGSVRSVASGVLVAGVLVAGVVFGLGAQASAVSGTTSTRTIQAAGLTRSFRLYRPAALAKTTKAPLVIALHEAGSSGAAFETRTGFDSIADNRNWLVVYPESQSLQTTSGPSKEWQYGCCETTEEGTQDLTFIRTMISTLVAQENVDPQRVWVTGFSVGASMADRLGCEASDVIAAIAPVNGGEARGGNRCTPAHPVTTYVIHGSQNDFEGCRSGQLLCYKGAAGYHPSSYELAQFWSQRDLCPGGPTSNSSGAVTTTDWTGCSGATAVRHSGIQGGGHCWPSLSAPSGGMNATTAIASFFAGKYLPPAAAKSGTANDADVVPVPIAPVGS